MNSPSRLFFNRTVTVEVPTYTRDETGAEVPNWEPDSTMTDLPVAIYPKNSVATTAAGQRQVLTEYRVYFAGTHGVRPGMRLLDDTGRYFTVQGFFDTQERGRLFVVDVTRIPAKVAGEASP